MLLVKKKDCNSGRVYNQLNGAVHFGGREGVTLNLTVPLTLGGKGNEGDIEANGAVDFGDQTGVRVTSNATMLLTLGMTFFSLNFGNDIEPNSAVDFEDDILLFLGINKTKVF